MFGIKDIILPIRKWAEINPACLNLTAWHAVMIYNLTFNINHIKSALF